MTFQEITSKLPKAYYQDDSVYIIHADCRDVLPLIPDKSVDLVLTDPPYGINHPTDYKARGRGKLAECSNYPPVYGDDKPFDPAPMLRLNAPTLLWGADHYADKLPLATGWVIWDKDRPDNLDQATCEMAWTNFIKGDRCFRFMWNGMIRASKEELVHPTQKPVALISWILGLRWTPSGVILDPYLGSGSTILAAKQAGRHAIGIEISEAYCEIAAKRCAQSVMSLEIPKPTVEQGSLTDWSGKVLDFDKLPENP